MNKICVYTCITGDYDNLIELDKKEYNIDYICYTNNKKIKSKTWQIKYIEDKKLNNVKLSRKIKILGTPELKKYDIVVWIDGRIKFVTSIKKFIDKFVDLNKYDLVGFKHNCRSTVNDEMQACFEFEKDSFENILKISKLYDKEQFPDNVGLLENSVLFRNFNNDKLNKAMTLWFDMIVKYSHRDQLSFPYVIWKTNLNVKFLNINIWNNEYFTNTEHALNKKIDAYINFYNQNEFKFNNYIIKELDITDNKLNFTIKPKVNCNTIKILLLCDKNMCIKKLDYDINTHITSYHYLNCSLGDDGILFSHFPTIQLEGNFTRDKKINFYILIDCFDNNEIYINNLNNKNLKIDKLNSEKLELENELNNLNKTLEKQSLKYDELNLAYKRVINSKRWKLFEKIRKPFK